MASSTTALAPIAPRIWGVFNSAGDQLLMWDNVTHIKIADKSKVSSFPIEKGSFTDYNKVDEPIDVSLTVTKGGSMTVRKEFLDAVRTLKSSTTLVNVITPERSFFSYSLESSEYAQASGKGQNLLIVNLNFKEIRQVASGGFSDAELPSPKPKSAEDEKHKGHGQPGLVEKAEKKFYETVDHIAPPRKD